MIRPTGIGVPAPAAKTRAARGARSSFRVDSGATASSAAAAEPSPETEMLSALIDLQGAAARDGERRRRIAAAQWALSLLDRLRVGLLDGSASDAELDALASATAALGGVGVDEALQSALADLELRARVELAKRGR